MFDITGISKALVRNQIVSIVRGINIHLGEGEMITYQLKCYPSGVDNYYSGTDEP